MPPLVRRPLAYVLPLVALSLILPLVTGAAGSPGAWTKLGPEGVPVFALVISPNFVSDQTMFAATRDGVAKSSDGGRSWEPTNNGLLWEGSFNGSRIGMAISPNFAEDTTVFVGSTNYGVFRTRDAGSTWEAVNTRPDTWNQAQVAVSPNYAADRTVIIGTVDGWFYGYEETPVTISTDGGNTWQAATVELPQPTSGTASEVYVSPAEIKEFAFSPNYTRDHTIFASLFGIHRSTNRSEQFAGIIKSNDAGATWRFLSLPVPTSHVYVPFTIGISPNFTSDQTLFVGTDALDGLHHVLKSVDGGTTWQASSSGMPQSDVQDILISPDYASDNTVYATTGGDGVFVSTDGGTTWQPFVEGLNGAELGGNDCGYSTTMLASPNYLLDARLFLAHSRNSYDSPCSGVWQYVLARNHVPTVGAITAPIDPLQVNTAVDTRSNFTDPDVADTHTASWNWGDKSTSQGDVDETDGSVTGRHTYTAVGVYTINMTVMDQAGASASAQPFQYVVVYDPQAGFVTGSGLINSPAGGYIPNPSLTGRANFGFVSKYQQGQTTPSGQTQFRFQLADLQFQSASYQWLVVSGPKVQVKGAGKINGTGNYGFLLSAIDGQEVGGGGVDRFRIKIWDKATDTVVYDNQLGAADDADATGAIVGGSITIQK